MNGIFNYDSPIMQGMRKALLLCWLNLLTLLLCIPIVTAGAAMTALYDSVNLLKDDCGNLTRNYFSSFFQNFLHASILWVLVLGLFAFFIADYYICTQLVALPFQIAQIVLIVESVFLVALLVWLFPLLARYDNKLWFTLKNAAILCVAYLPSTILMLILDCLPIVLFILVPAAFPFVVLFGLSLPVYLNTPLYRKIFQNLDSITAQK